MKVLPLHLLSALLLPCSLSSTLAAKTLPVSDYALTVLADRPDALYHENDKVTFNITVTHLGQPVDGKIDWKITKDGVEPPLESGTVFPAGTKPPYDERIIQASRYYDTVNFTARTKAPAFFTVGFIDILCPPTTVYGWMIKK